MALCLRNYKLIGFDETATQANTGVIYIDNNGNITAEVISGAEQIDCNGAYLSPGWCDLHVHVWHGGTDISVRANEAGRMTGVTAMADAGSAGEANFHGLREYVIEPQSETIKAFINIGSIGLVACNRVSELIDQRSIDIDKTLEVIDKNRDVICGIKVRASAVIVGNWGIGPAKIAKRMAEMTDLPLMVHVGEPSPLLDEVFDLLTPGDIITHCFNGKKMGSILDTPAIFNQAKSLAKDGVLMDVGHGVASFDFSAAKRAIAEGLLPFSISTDLHKRNINGPVFDLATTMSKLLAVGLPFEQCITAVTSQPRSVLKLSGKDGLNNGSKADFTLFELQAGTSEAIDSHGNSLTLAQQFMPTMTVIGTSALAAGNRYIEKHTDKDSNQKKRDVK